MTPSPIDSYNFPTFTKQIGSSERNKVFIVVAISFLPSLSILITRWKIVLSVAQEIKVLERFCECSEVGTLASVTLSLNDRLLALLPQAIDRTKRLEHFQSESHPWREASKLECF